MPRIFAQISATENAETIFRLTGIQENSDWLPPLAVAALLFVWFLRRYKIDAAELKPWQRTLLLLLRTAALGALLLYYLHPQWEHLVAHSRVAVVIDSSASMAGRDLMPRDENIDNTGPTRLEALVDWIERSELLEKLSQKHDVTFYAFHETFQSIPEATLKNLKADGPETRLGEALNEILQRERGQPLAGIVLLSDGGQNAGQDLETPLDRAGRQQIPILTVGVGAVTQPLNFRVGNLDVPKRALPSDPFHVRVPIEMQGGVRGDLLGEDVFDQTVVVELWLSGVEENTAEEKVSERELRFASDDPDKSVQEAGFELRIAEPGKRRLTAKIRVPAREAPEESDNPDDNSRSIVVEVVDRKDKILIFASAPMRDYQFLASLIHRDKSMSLDVYLPWAKPGISQNADKILEHFPTTRTEMAEYDVVIAFDPDWRVLSPEQVDVLEYWVARQGGGLWIFAGAIHQADGVSGWVADRGLDKIRALYPIEFHGRQSAFEHRYHGDEKPWPLKWSRAGEEADFLRANDHAAESRAFWHDFPGFYGFFAVRGVKPTATLLASSGSPETLGRDESGVLMAEQFFGSGRVLYFGSSEFWRLRRTDEKAYEQIALRLLRHISQGRLQRESDRASLTTDKQQYALGATARLRVTAADAQLNPLMLPTLPVDMVTPSGTLRTVEVSLDANLPGMYQGHVPMNEEGEWSIRFKIPGTEQEISRTVSVQMSDLERERPNRDETLLREIAEKSGGVYFASPTAALPPVHPSALFGDIDLFAATSDTKHETPSTEFLTELLKIRSQRAVPDTVAEEKMLRVLLLTICIGLMLEWTLRRVWKLA